jgi:hypothetical protein
MRLGRRRGWVDVDLAESLARCFDVTSRRVLLELAGEKCFRIVVGGLAETQAPLLRLLDLGGDLGGINCRGAVLALGAQPLAPAVRDLVAGIGGGKIKVAVR